MPATTSTAMKPAMIASATANQRRSASAETVGMPVIVVRGGVTKLLQSRL